MISDAGGKHMDLVKIGKYIAGKRKDLGMTQKQLAEKLGMSDKSVSKWERGVSHS
jgi:transcriptional regulator with XRE-family HTH domain